MNLRRWWTIFFVKRKSANADCSVPKLCGGTCKNTAAVWSAGAWQAMGDGDVTVITTTGERRFAAGVEIEGIPDPAGP